MGQVIVAELHEHGGNRSLFGEDENGEPYRARRVEEDDGGDYDDYVTGERHADLYDDADDAEGSVPAKARKVTAEEFLDSLTEDEDAEFAAEFRALLAKHRKVRGGAVGARPGGQVTGGQGVGGAGGRTSRESRRWANRLTGSGRPLTESRSARRWMGRLLEEVIPSSRWYERD
jgi:hypothetical protein